MHPGLRLLPALGAALALFAFAAPAAAQACAGLPSGRGVLSIGFEGTDGATGQGLGFAYQASGGALLLRHRALDDFTLAEEIRTGEAQLSARLPRVRLPLCLTLGAQWTGYDGDRLESESWSAERPGYRTSEYRLGGPYRRLRVPAGVGVGRELRLGERVSLVPFAQVAVVFESESYEPHGAPRATRSGWGLGGSVGMTAAVDWLVLRASVSHAAVHARALSGESSFPELSVHLGVRF